MVRVVICRRFLCTACGVVVLVVPRPVEPRRQYTRSAVALALALWGHFNEAADGVRKQVAPGVSFEGGWRSLRRWTRAVAGGALFPGYLTVGVTVGGQRLRETAGEIASWLAGFAPPGPPGEPLPHLAFRGAEHAR